MAVWKTASLVIGLTVTHLLVHALHSQKLVDHGYGVLADDPNTPILRELQLLVLPQDGKRHCRAGGAIMERRLTRMCLRGFCGDLRLFRILLDKNSNAAGSL